jgi:Mce-associated membrane protein
VTVVVEKTETTTAVEEAAPDNLARWHIRAAALVVDVVPGLAVVATMLAVWLAVPMRSVWWWLSASILAAAALLTMVNRVILPALHGWNLGRALMGIAVVRPDGASPGVGRLLCRDLAHLLDTLSVFVGWLWPLWDPRRRTFADLLLRTEVRCVEPDRRPRDVGRRAAYIVTSAALLCLAGAGSSLVAVYLPDRAADRTREAISVQGPKIVTEMLTYDPKSMQQQFARAQSLTTDNYRRQLVEQQEAAKKRQPVVNEYWTTNSTVLSATRDSATMLLFLQGHRGDGKEERPISATVRVSFVQAEDGRWLVDVLDPVTKPKAVQGKR